MAYLANPNYGRVPGAPAGLNWWSGNQFNMSDLLQSLPPALPVPPPPPPPPPMAATVTPQDVALQQLTLSGGRGAEPGGGGPGTGAGGIGNAPQPGMPNPGMGGGIGTPGGNQTFSGYPGVYSQSPVDINSQFGLASGLVGGGIGQLGGIPGPGTVLGAAGSALDAARYNGTLAQYGIEGRVNPWGAAAAGALASIGVPFTNWDLAHLFSVPTARERMDAILAGAPPGLYNEREMGYGALQANQPVGTPTRESGPLASYPQGFIEAMLPGYAPTQTAPNITPDAEVTKGAFDPGAYAEAAAAKGAAAGDMTVGGQSTGTAADKGGLGAPGDTGGTSGRGGDKGSDPFGGLYARGGLIGAPPGRYAAGGAVAMPGDNITPQQFGLLRSVNPPGPDDQIGALQTGEGVITRKSMGKGWAGLLAPINAGKLDPAKVKGLLAAKPRPRR